jgi:hypothetical protein
LLKLYNIIAAFLEVEISINEEHKILGVISNQIQIDRFVYFVQLNVERAHVLIKHKPLKQTSFYTVATKMIKRVKKLLNVLNYVHFYKTSESSTNTFCT